MRLDFGGIAKGFATEEALAMLKAAGLPRALINASGNVALGNPPPGERGWKVGVAALNPASRRRNSCVWRTAASRPRVTPFSSSRSTGGGIRHILDPHTGIGLSEHVSATVVAPDATLADAWATAVCVLGPDAGTAGIGQLEDVACYFVRLEQGELRTYRSAGLPEFAN